MRLQRANEMIKTGVFFDHGQLRVPLVLMHTYSKLVASFAVSTANVNST